MMGVGSADQTKPSISDHFVRPLGPEMDNKARPDL